MKIQASIAVPMSSSHVTSARVCSRVVGVFVDEINDLTLLVNRPQQQKKSRSSTRLTR